LMILPKTKLTLSRSAFSCAKPERSPYLTIKCCLSRSASIFISAPSAAGSCANRGAGSARKNLGGYFWACFIISPDKFSRHEI
jgi:hypothetical protein